MSIEKVHIFGRQLVAARGLLGMSQSDLADAAGLSQPHLAKIELGKVIPHESTVARLRDAIENRGVEFTNGNNPGVRLKGDKAVNSS